MSRNELYLGAWDFNKCAICDKIEFLVKKNGGTLYGYYHPGIIHRRCDGSIGEARQTNHCDTFGSSVSFEIDGTYYYVSFDDNPFFDFHYHKIKLNDKGKYVGEYYCDNFPKSWLVDSLLSHNVTEEELYAAAVNIMKTLFSMRYSERVRHTKRIRVSNIYDNGSHMEIVDATDKKERAPYERRECLC